MTERVMNIDAFPAYFISTLHTERVRVRESGNSVIVEPAADEPEKKYRCPLLGIANDSSLTVEKFLEWKNEDRRLEYEQELRQYGE